CAFDIISLQFLILSFPPALSSSPPSKAVCIEMSSSDYQKTPRKLSDRAFSEPLIQFEKKNEDEQYIDLFGTRTRFVVMLLVLLCLTSIWSNILSFNFAIICMAPKEGNASGATDSYAFTKNESSWITSVVALGALVANFPVVSVVNRFGTRLVFSMLGVVSAAATVALPWAIRSGFTWILVLRALQGMSFAGNFTVIGAFCSRWTYFKQTGVFVAILVSYVQLSPAITMPVSGALCSAFSWSSVFYAHGLTTMLLFVIYGLFYRNNPQKHPFVGPLESRKISTGKVVETKTVARVPYAEILSTPAVWAVWAGAIGNFTAVNLMFLYSPTYLSAVLGLSANSTGITAALPPFTQFLVKLICGVISDRIHCISERTKFRLFNSIAFGGSACCFLMLACMGTETKSLNMVLLGGAAGILGCSTGGFYKAGPVISKQYSYFVTGNISLMLTLTMIVVPFMVSVLTPNNTQEEWRWVFVITAVVQLMSNILFCLFIRGEPCEWTREAERELVEVRRSDLP
ncbi:hypothetical protein PENTCL1PPCAC_9268, partial [Pristionchus entomophagus]